MDIINKLQQHIEDKGLKQKYIIEQIKKNNPNTTLTECKLSLALNGNRNLLAEELIEIIAVLKIDPNTFIQIKKEIKPQSPN